jgi:hypothetical protein
VVEVYVRCAATFSWHFTLLASAKVVGVEGGQVWMACERAATTASRLVTNGAADHFPFGPARTPVDYLVAAGS